MKKQARLQSEKVFKNPTDKILDTLGNIDNTAGSQDISTGVQPDTLKKLTFQVRDSLYRQLIKSHSGYIEELGSAAPDREVMVEEAIARLLENLEEWKENINHRQRQREQDLESGALVNPSSRKRKN